LVEFFLFRQTDKGQSFRVSILTVWTRTRVQGQDRLIFS